MSKKLFHITPKKNKDSILSEGIKPSSYTDYVHLARTPYQAYCLAGPNIIGYKKILSAQPLTGIYPEIPRKTYSLFGVDTEGLTFHRTILSHEGELVYEGTIPPERLTYIGDIDTKDATLTLADAVLNLETLQPIKKERG